MNLARIQFEELKNFKAIKYLVKPELVKDI